MSLLVFYFVNFINLLFFFFFPAEDGILDHCVTGVQTCALPISRHLRRKGQTWEELGYAITSLPPERAGAARLLELWRGHWGIENRLHWVRDVTFDEDRSQIRTGSAPQVMAALRNTAIGVLRRAGHDNLAAATRHYAAR